MIDLRTLIVVIILLITFFGNCHASNNSKSTTSSSSSILVVGATGTTGLRAIQGILDVGYQPSQLHIVTRNKSKPKMKQLKKLGFHIVQADLQHPSSLTNIGKGCTGCYIHATGGDTAELDTSEVSSAQNLCNALHTDIKSIIYNSSAAEKDHGVARIQQKHDVETILSERRTRWHVTSLRANLFDEELWKQFTRPEILKGKYPLPCNRWKKTYLTSVRDMGRIAGTIIARQESEEETNNKQKISSSTNIRIINVPGDHLTGPQIAKCFSKAQGSKVRYYNNYKLTKMAKKSFPELYQQIKFLQTNKETTNIEKLKREFPGLISSFEEFLEETKWSDLDRMFDDLSNPQMLQF